MKKNKYPKVKFEIGSLEDNIEIIKEFYNDMKSNIKFLYEGINKNNIEEKVKEFYNNNQELFEKNRKEYEKEWNKVSDDYFKYITELLNINPKIKDITCYILYIPTFPRDIHKNTFYVGTNMEKDFIISTIKHEITHFYWFKKFKELYKDIDEKEFDTPYIPWIYSEIVIDPLIHEKAYDEFYELNYNGENVMEHLRGIYNKNIKIEDKIKEGYDYIKEVYKEKENK